MSDIHPLLSGNKLTINYDCNFTPIYITSDTQALLFIDDLWTGGVTKGRKVPRVNDIVSDRQSGFYWVTYVDSDGIAKLERWNPFQNNDSEVPNVFLGRNRTQEANNLYIDTDVHPYRIAVDGRIAIKGSQYKYCKIFLGSDTSENGIVISRWMENDEISGTSIPLELVKTDEVTNYTEKSPKVAWTNRLLNKGEFVTLVAFGDESVGTTEIPLVVRKSSVLRGGDVRKKRITGISISSPYLSKHDSDVIEFPINRTLTSLDIEGVVHYEGGSVETLPIDGNRFRLLGLDMVRTNIPGAESKLGLSYTLQDSEDSLDSLTNGTCRITRPYVVRAMSQIKQYNVKLFVMPVWNLATHSWKLKYFLYSLDRLTMVEVTDHVVNGGVASPNFDGKNYSDVQHLSVAVQLKDVFPDYPEYRHIQDFQISLKGPWKSNKYPYTLSYNLSGDPLLGEQIHLKLFENSTDPYVQVNDGFRHQYEWLDAMFFNSVPMWDGELEKEAPRPTHFRLTNESGDELGYWGIDRWNDDLDIAKIYQDDNTFFFHFVKETESNDLHLGCVAVGSTRVGTPEKPVIRKQPQAIHHVQVGDTFRLTCKADGMGDLKYQWFWRMLNNDNHGQLPIGSNPIQDIVATADMDNRYYYCVVSNEHGEANTANSTVYIVTPTAS